MKFITKLILICFIPLFIVPTYAQAQLASDNSFSFGFCFDEKCKGDVIDGWPDNKGILAEDFDASIDLIGPHSIQVFVICGENKPSCSNIELFAMPIDVEFEPPWKSLPKVWELRIYDEDGKFDNGDYNFEFYDPQNLTREKATQMIQNFGNMTVASFITNLEKPPGNVNLGIYAKSYEGEENSFLISSSTALDKKITDTDGDGISDWDEENGFEYNDEVWYTDPYEFDMDDDMLSDFEEITQYGTDPNLADTDEDNMKDGGEILVFKTDPTNPDENKDEIPDYEIYREKYALDFEIKDISNMDLESGTYEIAYDLSYSNLVFYDRQCVRDFENCFEAHSLLREDEEGKFTYSPVTKLPELNFYNSKELTILSEKNNTNLEKYGRFFEHKDISATLKNKFHFKNFPFESYVFNIFIELPESFESKIDEKESAISPYPEFLFVDGTIHRDFIEDTPRGLAFPKNYTDIVTDIVKREDFANSNSVYSRAVYTVELEKPPLISFFQIIFPMLLITGLGALIFWLDIQSLTKIELGAIFLTSFVFFTQLVYVDNPHITYFTLFDYIARFCYVVFLIAIVSPAIQLKMERKKIDQRKINKVENYGKYGLIALLLIGTILVFHYVMNP